MVFEFWSQCFALTVCGSACGLLTTMDLQESTDDADKNAGAWTLQCIFGLLFILMVINMMKLGYNATDTSKNGFVTNFMHSIIPVVFSVVLGINMYFTYYYKNDSGNLGKFITSLVCGLANILIAFKVTQNIASLPVGYETIGSYNYAWISLLMVSIIVSASLNVSLSSNIDSKDEIHAKSKLYYKGGNIALIVGLCLFVCYIILVKFEEKHKKGQGAPAAQPELVFE